METTVDGAPSFGRRLRRLRAAAGLTQAELAERAGISVKGIAALETGRRQRPHPPTVRALAEALGLSGEVRAELVAIAAARGDALAPADRARITPPPARRPPSAPTELIGRDGDLDALSGLLESGSRLVTITGPGGVGKTSLSVRLARDSADRFPDGVAFVDLAPLSDAALVLPAIAHALGLREVGGQFPRDELHAYLSGRLVLLVLDNLEQVLDAAPEIADMVASVDGMHVLVTSRAPLRVRGEREYHLQPLTVPLFGRIPNVEDAAQSPAIRLFVERACAVASGFELTRSNVAAVTAICRRLDGLPLAIELAAAWLRTLSPTELLARLDRSLPLLTGGARDLPERQRTMRAAIGWSYQLLEEPQRRLLNRLSVFRGGWDLEAAEAVGADGHIAGEEVLALLSGLVEHSLVFVEPREDGRTRYRMLVPVREYAEELREASGEADDVHRRHAGYFLALAERAEPELAGPGQSEYLERLEKEHDNLRAALSWSLKSGDIEPGLRMGNALSGFWVVRGYSSEGRSWLEQLLAAGGDVAPALRARVFSAAAELALQGADIARARDLSAQSVVLARETEDRAVLARSLAAAGHVALQQGAYLQAKPLLEESLTLARETVDGWATRWCLLLLGMVAVAEGEIGLATELCEESVALAREAGDEMQVLRRLYDLGGIAVLQGETERVRPFLEAGLATSHNTGATLLISHLSEMLGRVSIAEGDTGTARSLFAASIGAFRETGSKICIAHWLEGFARLALCQEQPERAALLLGASAAVSERHKMSMMPIEGALYNQTVGAVQAQLGEASFGAAREKGRAMTTDQAVGYALSDAEGGG